MSEIDKISENCEYISATQLTGLASKYISIPSSIILDTDIDSKRVAVFSYFRIKKGLDDSIGFTIPSVVKWCGNKPDTRSNGVSKKFMDVIYALSNRGYLTLSDELSKTAYIECEFNSDKIFEECQSNSFAVIYLDELKVIMNYKKENNKDAFLNNTILLLVFAYFRSMIYRRSNKLRPEERNVNNMNNHNIDVDARRKCSPEAYADTYNNIAEQLGISARIVSKAVSILEQELRLLVTDEAYHIRNENGEFRTQYTLFANAYKREGKLLLADGETYSRAEIERKAENIKKYNSKFIIDEKKRKTMKGDW